MWFAKSSFLSNTDTPLAKKICHLMFQLRSDLFPETVPDVPIHLHFKKPRFGEPATLTRCHPTESLSCDVLKEARLLTLPPLLGSGNAHWKRARRRGERPAEAAWGSRPHLLPVCGGPAGTARLLGPVRTPAPAASHCQGGQAGLLSDPSFLLPLCKHTSGGAHPARHGREERAS